MQYEDSTTKIKDKLQCTVKTSNHQLLGMVDCKNNMDCIILLCKKIYYCNP